MPPMPSRFSEMMRVSPVPVFSRDRSRFMSVNAIHVPSGDGVPRNRSTSPLSDSGSGEPTPLAGMRTNSNSPVASESPTSEPSGMKTTSR